MEKISWLLGDGTSIKPSLQQEIYFYANAGNKIRSDDIAAESTTVTARDVGNQELTDALIAPDGLMGVGFQPQVTAATEQGQTALLESLNTENKIEKRTAKKEKKETTSKAEPQTLEESFS